MAIFFANDPTNVDKPALGPFDTLGLAKDAVDAMWPNVDSVDIWKVNGTIAFKRLSQLRYRWEDQTPNV